MIARIPVKIVRTEDMVGNKKIGIMADLAYQSNADDSAKIQALKTGYAIALGDAEKFISSAKTKKPSDMWAVSSILKRFADSAKKDFIISNYAMAVRRDLNLGRYAGTILRLSEHIGREKITDMALMGHYDELLRARTRLVVSDSWDDALERLVGAARAGTLPSCRAYRQELAKMGRPERGRGAASVSQADIRKFT